MTRHNKSTQGKNCLMKFENGFFDIQVSRALQSSKPTRGQSTSQSERISQL
jgi:hypothetical protein